MVRSRKFAVQVVLGVLLLGMAVGTAGAGPVTQAVVPESLAALGVTGPASAQDVESYNYKNTFTGLVTSQAFQLNNGEFLYLYQAANSGPSALEEFGVSPVYDVGQIGYLTDNVLPAGFQAGGYVPPFVTLDNSLAQPNLVFYFPGYIGADVPAGQDTVTMYVISPDSPILDLGGGFVMDSGVAGVNVFTTVSSTPEPATLGLLGAGLVLTVWRRRRQQA